MVLLCGANNFKDGRDYMRKLIEQKKKFHDKYICRTEKSLFETTPSDDKNVLMLTELTDADAKSLTLMFNPK
jgi:hypothetical protein